MNRKAKTQKKPPTPQNRRGTGVKPLNGGVHPTVGKATQFKPGESGNPGGRPKKLISAAYEELANKKVPNDPKGRTYAEVLAEGQFRAAIKGMTQAAKEITDRLEGKAPQPVEVSGPEGGDVNLNLTVHFVDPDENQPA